MNTKTYMRVNGVDIISTENDAKFLLQSLAKAVGADENCVLEDRIWDIIGVRYEPDKECWIEARYVMGVAQNLKGAKFDLVAHFLNSFIKRPKEKLKMQTLWVDQLMKELAMMEQFMDLREELESQQEKTRTAKEEYDNFIFDAGMPPKA